MFAVFPLNIVVLPEESVALHLFEPKYRQLFKDFKNGNEFSIVYKNKHGISNFGTLVFIEKIINEFPDDTVDVIVKGVSIVQVNQFHIQFPEKLYAGIDAEIIETGDKATETLIELYKKFLQSMGKRFKKSPTPSIHQIANRLELSQEKKNEFIQQSNLEGKNRFLVNEIKFILKIMEQEVSLNHKFHLN